MAENIQMYENDIVVIPAAAVVDIDKVDLDDEHDEQLNDKNNNYEDDDSELKNLAKKFVEGKLSKEINEKMSTFEQETMDLPQTTTVKTPTNVNDQSSNNNDDNIPTVTVTMAEDVKNRNAESESEFVDAKDVIETTIENGKEEIVDVESPATNAACVEQPATNATNEIEMTEAPATDTVDNAEIIEESPKTSANATAEVKDVTIETQIPESPATNVTNDTETIPESPKTSANTAAETADVKSETELSESPVTNVTNDTEAIPESPKTSANTATETADVKSETEIPESPATNVTNDSEAIPESPKTSGITAAEPAEVIIENGHPRTNGVVQEANGQAEMVEQQQHETNKEDVQLEKNFKKLGINENWWKERQTKFEQEKRESHQSVDKFRTIKQNIRSGNTRSLKEHWEKFGKLKE